VDRAYLYYFNDSDEPILHGSSGITRNFAPKPAYYAMAHLYRTLGDYRFSRVVREDKDDLYVFEYVNPVKPGQPVWVIWSPTGTQRAAVKRIAVPGRLVKAEAMALTAGGAEKPNFRIVGGAVELDVTESPVYLWLDERS
jgi:serine/threonine-protein kinase ATR